MSAQRHPSSVEELRRAVRIADQELVRIIGRRLELAQRIAAAKRRQGHALRNYAVEARVLSRWRVALGRWGVPAPRAESLTRWMIEEALRAQERRLRWSPERCRRDGTVEIAIVGGAGAMGRWLAGFLEDSGRRVAVVDPRAVPGERPMLPDVESAVRAARVVIFATPIRSTRPLLQRALVARGRAVLLDILSVKAPIQSTIERGARSGVAVSSLHPLFGPSVKTLSGRNLLIVSAGVPAADRVARDLFRNSAVSITTVPLAQHDRWIAESLGLSHLVNLLFLSAVSQDRLPVRKLAHASSTTFRRQGEVALDVACEGAELYLDIQSENPWSRRIDARLDAALRLLRSNVRGHDLPGFEEILRRGRTKLEQALGPSARSSVS